MIKFFNLIEYIDLIKAISIIIGGRGIGKTYSAFSFLLENQDKRFIYMRNTVTQLDESCSAFGNPFKRWAADHNRNIYMEKEKNHAMIYEETEEGTKLIGYGVALSTFENLRGIDLSDVDYVLFDEFIERRKFTFAQYESFVHFYETVNRNRELFGEPPLKCFLLSNSQKLDNPILAGYGLIPVIENMIRNGQKRYRSGGILVLLPESEVSDLKAQTEMYKMINGSKIADENLKNKFAFDSFYGIQKRNLIEYLCVCAVDDIYIYKHKSNNKYYACQVRSDNVKEFSIRDNRIVFYRTYGRQLELAAAKGTLEYSDFVVKTKLLEILK